VVDQGGLTANLTLSSCVIGGVEDKGGGVWRGGQSETISVQRRKSRRREAGQAAACWGRKGGEKSRDGWRRRVPGGRARRMEIGTPPAQLYGGSPKPLFPLFCFLF
jgi:hypothetical protein